MDQLVLAPKWRPLNGVDPSCWILKPSGSNILHDTFIEGSHTTKNTTLGAYPSEAYSKTSDLAVKAFQGKLCNGVAYCRTMFYNIGSRCWIVLFLRELELNFCKTASFICFATIYRGKQTAPLHLDTFSD